MICSTTSTICASSDMTENKLLNENAYRDDRLVVLQTVEYEELNGFSISYEFDGVNYTAIKIANDIFVYETGRSDILVSASLNETIKDYTPQNSMARVAWSAWYFYAQNSTRISWKQELALDAVEGIILSLLKINGYVGTASSSATAIAVKVWNSKAKDIVVKYYHSCASTCGILVKEKDETYADGILQHQTGESSPFWMGNPYDYTQPSGCRLLVNEYPY